jgi:uncharacterized GH25 family protein
MNRLKPALLIVMCLLFCAKISAHALWIETPVVGRIGQKQEIKVFYGEYSNNERDDIAKWYSDVKDFSIWLTAPGKEKIKLQTTPGTNFYSTHFTPDKNGLYLLTVSHEAKELGGSTKYEFLSAAMVAVGEAVNVNHSLIPVSFHVTLNEVKSYKLNEAVKFTVVQNGKSMAKKKVAVFSPDGWTKEIISDENGEVIFTPQWAGRYVLESTSDEKISGEHYGKSFTAAWQGATCSFEVVR